MRNRVSTWSQKFLLTNYLLIAKGKLLTIQWRNWMTSYSIDQNGHQYGILLSLDVTLGGQHHS